LNPNGVPQQKWFLAGFGGMSRLRSFKSQAPSSKEVPSPKLQRAGLDGHPHRSGLGLELENWSFSGAWSLVLGALLRAIENSDEQRK